MKKYVYVTSSFDYSDEFDVEGCFVEEKQVFDDEMALVEEAFADGRLKDVEEYFGTNEAIEFDCFEDYERGLTVKECSKAFYLEFIELNGGTSVGKTFSLVDEIEEEDEDYEDFDDEEEDEIDEL